MVTGPSACSAPVSVRELLGHYSRRVKKSPAPALELDHFDAKVRPQDDLYRFVNGGWLATAEIPEDKPLTGAFMELRDQAEIAVRDIITELGENHDELNRAEDKARIANLYASFMDTEAIEAGGSEPLHQPLADIAAISSIDDLVEHSSAMIRQGLTSIVGVGVDADPGDPNNYALFVGQSGLGLPDEEYYRTEEYADIRDAYVAHIERTLALGGVEDPAEQARAVMSLETQIAACHWDKVETRDMRKMYNPTPLADYGADTVPLAKILAGAGITIEDLVVVDTQPSYLTDVAALLVEDQLPSWRAWARWHTISGMSPMLSSAFVDERFGFYGTTLSGTPKLKERWKRGVSLVESVLGEAVGKVYVERHFPPEAKQQMDELVVNLIEAYRLSIIDLEWMSEDTKAEALNKLTKFTPKIGFPDVWRDYSALDIRPGDLQGNVERATAFELDYEFAKIGKPVLAHEWFMTPQTVNAYYHPLRNEIVFPAAICQPPFFNVAADEAINYGGIGAVIGHEIGHGFDDQGSTCDGDGRLRDWWTDADRSAFEERTNKLVEQYNELEPEQTPGQHVNGELTIGENIGDLGGLSIAFKAWQLAVADTEAATTDIDGYTPAQRLFLGWAAVWQQKSRTETVRQRLATDPHSPPEFRCNQILKNLDEFVHAFKVEPEDDLWLDPEERVTIW